MLEIVTDYKKISIKEWKKFVFSHPDGNFFQHPESFNFFKGLDGYNPFIIAAKEKNKIIGLISGIIIRKNTIKGCFSKRAIIWGGPLIEIWSELLFRFLFLELEKITKKVIYVEFRNLFNLSEHTDSFQKFNFKYIPYLNIRVNTKSKDNLLKKKISKSKIRQIKTSLKQGAKIKEPSNKNELKNFYHILKKLYKTKIKKPFPSFQFFLKFYENKKLGKYFLIEYKDQIIGGIMCPIYNNRIIYEWYIAGLDGYYKKIFPSVLATWAPINYAIENELEYFDFMGAGTPCSDYGVREFKKKFGGKMYEYGRYLKINQPITYKIGILGLRISRILS